MEDSGSALELMGECGRAAGTRERSQPVNTARGLNRTLCSTVGGVRCRCVRVCASS